MNQKKGNALVFSTAVLLVTGLWSCTLAPSDNSPSQSYISGTPSPLCGLVLWGSNPDIEAYADAVTLEFSYFYYSDVASDNGSGGYNYDWTELDAFLQAAAGRGHHGIVRFRDTDPELGMVNKSLPASLWTNTRTVRYDEGIEGAAPITVVFPDWSNSGIGDFMVEFWQKLAERYPDPSTGLAYVEVGFGLWGEYHLDFDNLSVFSDPTTSTKAGAMGKLFPSRSEQKRILSAVNTAFVNMPWGISIDAADADFGPYLSPAAASGLDFGLFDDSLLHEDWADSNRNNWSFFGSGRKLQVNGGEFSYYTDHDQRYALLSKGPHGTSLSQIGQNCGLSFVIADGQTQWHSPAVLAGAGSCLGYSIHVVEKTYTSGVLSIRVRNNGVATVSHPVRAVADLLESDLDLQGLQPGQERLLTIGGLSSESAVLGFTSPYLIAGQEIPWTGP